MPSLSDKSRLFSILCQLCIQRKNNSRMRWIVHTKHGHYVAALACWDILVAETVAKLLRMLHSTESVSRMPPLRNISTSAAEKRSKIPSFTWGDVIIEVEKGLGHVSGFKNIQYMCFEEGAKFVCGLPSCDTMQRPFGQPAEQLFFRNGNLSTNSSVRYGLNCPELWESS